MEGENEPAMAVKDRLDLKEPPPSSAVPRKKPGPKPNVADHQRVLEIVRGICGEDWDRKWRQEIYAGAIAEELDEQKIALPKPWLDRQPVLYSWKKALDKEKKL